jgi:hypothetical protein
MQAGKQARRCAAASDLRPDRMQRLLNRTSQGTLVVMRHPMHGPLY